MLEGWLKPMREESVDTIVLGCTHYPLVAQSIKEIMQRELVLIQTGEAIAKRLLILSEKKGHHNQGKFEMEIYATNGISTDMVKVILSKKVEVKTISL
jgi:glutamate racemase